MCREGIGIHQIARELEVDRERDQVLLRTVVKLALDAASVGIVGDGQPLAGRSQLFDLDAQPVERLLRRLDMRKLRGRPPARGLREVVRHRTRAVKGPTTPLETDGSLLRNRLPPP
jgi:hypothetical protein